MTQLASESLDRRLGGFERMVLRAHLLCCRSCRRYFGQIKVLHQAFHDLVPFEHDCEADAVDPGPALPDEVRERIKRRLNQE